MVEIITPLHSTRRQIPNLELCKSLLFILPNSRQPGPGRAVKIKQDEI